MGALRPGLRGLLAPVCQIGGGGGIIELERSSGGIRRRTRMAGEVKGPAPELERAEIPWVVAYLREDIQDLRVRV